MSSCTVGLIMVLLGAETVGEVGAGTEPSVGSPAARRASAAGQAPEAGVRRPGQGRLAQAPQPAWVPPMRSAAIRSWYPESRKARMGSAGRPRAALHLVRSRRTSV